VRLDRTDPEDLQLVLDGLLQRLEAGTIPIDEPGLTMSLVRIARVARLGGQPEAARALLRAALGADPRLALGLPGARAARARPEQPRHARRYLDLLTFVDQYDRDAGLTLAQLHFQRLGQPDKAADVVRRTYPAACPSRRPRSWQPRPTSTATSRTRSTSSSTRRAARSSRPTPTSRSRASPTPAASDDVARQLYDTVLQKLPPDDPRRPACAVAARGAPRAPADAPPAEGEAPAAGADAGAAPAESPPAAAASTAGAPSPPN
jgi:hypothetical protein